MTIGERLDNSIADGLVALGSGLRRAWIVGGTVGHHLLSLRPAKYEQDPAYLAADRLAEAEESREVWEPGELNDDPSQRLTKCDSSTCGCQEDARYAPLDIQGSFWGLEDRAAGLYPSGQPVDLPEEGVAQHPLYRELQEQHELWSPPGGDPCATLVYNTMPNWQAPQTSTPGSRSEAPVVVDTAPGSVSPPDMDPGRPTTKEEWARLLGRAQIIPEQPVGVGASEPESTSTTSARFAAADWLEATLGATGIECGAGWVLWLVDSIAERLNTPERPAGVDDHPGDAGGAVRGGIR